MIKSFVDKRTAAIFAGYAVRDLPLRIQKRARAKLLAIDAAKRLDDLRVPPGNRLEALHTDREGHPHQRSMADLFRVARRRKLERRDRRLPLRSKIVTIRREDTENRKVDFSDVASGRRLPPVHPGEILRDEFLTPIGISVYELANAIKAPRSRVNDVVLGRRSITIDTALRLGRYFGTSAEFWINLQARHDLDVADRTVRQQIEKEVAPRAA